MLGLIARFDLATHFYATQQGHHPVKDHQIGQRFGDHQKRLFAIFSAPHGETLGLKIVAQNLALRRLILNQQDLRFE